MKKLSLVTLLVLVILCGCAPKTPADFDKEKDLYDYGMKLYNNRDYYEAVKFFETYKNKYPTGSYITEAEFKLAESYFKKGDFIEAIYAFQSFRSLHPTNPKIPQAIYMTAVSYYKQTPGSIDRDQTNTANSINTIEELLAKHPNFEEAGKARDLLAKCRRMLAERELYIGNFYYKQSSYQAAIGRLETVKNDYEFKDLKEEALYKLAVSYNKLKDRDKTVENLNALLSMDPSVPYKKRADALLAKLNSGRGN